MNSYKVNKNILNLLYITCFISNISQLPFLWENRVISLVYTLGWLVAFGILFQSYMHCILYHRRLIFYLIIFDILVLLGYMLTGRYLGSNFIRPVHLSSFIFIIGLMLADCICEENLRRLSLIYIISTGIVVLYVYFETFRGVNWAESDSYLFLAKNSISTIILTAIVLCGVYWWNKHKIISSIAIAMFSAIIFMMKARAAILILCLIVGYVVLFKIRNVAIKVLLIVALLGIAIFIFNDDTMYNLIIKQIILNNREYSIDTFTTGRSTHFETFVKQFPNYWWNGTGGTYLECFPLAVLLSYGVVGGGALILLALTPVSIVFSYKWYYAGYNQSLKTLLTLLCIAVITNGLFEELAPFGPGVKCYMLWLISGIVFGKLQGGYIDGE